MADDSKKLSLKLLIDKKGHRVLFAEAGKDFVDFLFGLLALPVSSVIKLLETQDNMIGGLSMVYKSLSDLSIDYILPKQNKDVLLNPKYSPPFVSNNIPLPSIQASSSPSPAPPTYRTAGNLFKCRSCVSSLLGPYYTLCPTCKLYRMTTLDTTYFVKSPVLDAQQTTKEQGFVKGLVTYVVMDDLSVSVSPLSTLISNITLLSKFDIKDLGSLEEKVVDIGVNECLEILKHSLSSKTVLTDVFLPDVVVINENPTKRSTKRCKTER